MIALNYVILGYRLWALFLACMALKEAWPRLPLPVKILASPLALKGVVVDFVFNMASTIPFWDWPHELMFTQRCGRYIREGGRRGAVARVLCRYLMDPFQQGGHCNWGG